MKGARFPGIGSGGLLARLALIVDGETGALVLDLLGKRSVALSPSDVRDLIRALQSSHDLKRAGSSYSEATGGDHAAP